LYEKFITNKKLFDNSLRSLSVYMDL